MLSPTRTRRTAKSITKMAIKNRRNSVGTTQKPTSTNKIKMIKEVQRTNTRRREETRRTTWRALEVVVQPVTIKARLVRKSSKLIQSKTMKTGTSAETWKEGNNRLTSRLESDSAEVAQIPASGITIPILTNGMSSVVDQVTEAWCQWTETSIMREKENLCRLTNSEATMTSMFDTQRRRSGDLTQEDRTTTREATEAANTSCIRKDQAIIQCRPTVMSLSTTASDPATAATVLVQRDKTIEKEWACTLIKEEEASHTTRIILLVENQGATQATSSPKGQWWENNQWVLLTEWWTEERDQTLQWEKVDLVDRVAAQWVHPIQWEVHLLANPTDQTSRELQCEEEEEWEVEEAEEADRQEEEVSQAIRRPGEAEEEALQFENSIVIKYNLMQIRSATDW
jgi:hypothetical protein